MKILISSSKNQHLLGPQYLQGFIEKGLEAYGTCYGDVAKEKINYSFVNKVLLKLVPFYFYQDSNEILLKDVNLFKPDILVILKGMEIFPETLIKIKEKGIKLVNYNLDHPFRFAGSGSGNKYVLNSIPLYDLHISYSKEIIKELNVKYPGIATEYLPFGYHSYVDDLEFSSEEIIKVCFIGHADKKRYKIVKFLIENQIPIDIYGNNWRNYFKKRYKNLNLFEGVYNDNYWDVLNKYRVNLNILREHNFNSHNMRTFEIPASRGIMLSEFTSEQADFFEPNKEAFYYSSFDELLVQVKRILNMTTEQALFIRHDAYIKNVKCMNSYKNRSQQLINVLNQILGKK